VCVVCGVEHLAVADGVRSFEGGVEQTVQAQLLISMSKQMLDRNLKRTPAVWTPHGWLKGMYVNGQHIRMHDESTYQMGSVVPSTVPKTNSVRPT
jgi:hypothetical protein